MQAVVRHAYGSVETVETTAMARPVAGPDEVLVEVHAAGVDRGTVHLMTGKPYLMRIAGFGFTKPKQPILGFDVAGRVVAVGSDVERFTPGDEVFGIASGSFAEYAVAQQDKLARKPRNLTFDQAAGVAVSGITALQGLTDVGRLQAGQHVLVIGASGGVGSYAVQIAKALGAEVTGVASAPKLDLVRSLGADHVIDYTTQDFAATERRYDLILDIGGASRVSRLRSVLSPTGTLVIVGAETGGSVTGGVGRQIRASMLSLFIRQRLTMFISNEHYSSMEPLADLIESGNVIPAVGRRFDLADTAEAIRRLENGESSGKSVIVVRPDRKTV